MVSYDGDVEVKYIAFDYSGWPFHRSREFGELSESTGDDFESRDHEQIDRILPNLTRSLFGGSAWSPIRYGGWGFIAANAALAVLALAALAIVLERRIRRRASK